MNTKVYIWKDARGWTWGPSPHDQRYDGFYTSADAAKRAAEAKGHPVDLVATAPNKRKVVLTYFRQSGKYYSAGEYETTVEMYHDWEIYAEVRKMRTDGRLPGLVEGAREFHVHVDGEDVVPALLLLEVEA